MFDKQMSQRVWFILVVLVMAAPQLAFAQLAWKQREVELDAKLGVEAVEAVFTFSNESKQPVTITSVKSSCGCATTELDKKTYEPHESGQITARFDLGDRVGKQIKRIVVKTDSEQSPISTLTMQVNIPEVLKIRPRLVYWRAGEAREPKVVRIEVVQQEPPVQILKAIVSAEGVKAELKKPKAGNTYELVLTPVAGAEAVDVNVRLLTDLPQEKDEAFHGFRVLARLLSDSPQSEQAKSGSPKPDTENAAEGSHDTLASKSEDASTDSQ